jgi:hypothetical protein
LIWSAGKRKIRVASSPQLLFVPAKERHNSVDRTHPDPGLLHVLAIGDPSRRRQRAPPSFHCFNPTCRETAACVHTAIFLSDAGFGLVKFPPWSSRSSGFRGSDSCRCSRSTPPGSDPASWRQLPVLSPLPYRELVHDDDSSVGGWTRWQRFNHPR